MYLSIGGDMAVRDSCILGIFDLDNTSYSRHTRRFLAKAEENGQIVSINNELPKAFLLTEEFGMTRLYLTQFSAGALERRSTYNFPATRSLNL